MTYCYLLQPTSTSQDVLATPAPVRFLSIPSVSRCYLLHPTNNIYRLLLAKTCYSLKVLADLCYFIELPMPAYNKPATACSCLSLVTPTYYYPGRPTGNFCHEDPNASYCYRFLPATMCDDLLQPTTMHHYLLQPTKLHDYRSPRVYSQVLCIAT